MIKIISIIVVIAVIACNSKSGQDKKAIDIVSKCIEAHGGRNYQDLDVSFDFRDIAVHLKQQGGVYLYERTFKDSLNNLTHDSLTNNTFIRRVNGKEVEVPSTESDKFKEATNALAYFALLPYKLSEPAVILKYMGEINIDNKKYDKIVVTFEEDGGGKDHQDEFCYWINKDNHMLDYLSYASGGPRLRKATKRVKIDGVIFQDYENYEIMDTTIATYNYDKAFLEGKARLLSKIEQRNYRSAEVD